jgi:hypothetical protein
MPVTDLTLSVPWNAEGKSDASADPFEVAVPSGNSGAERERFDAAKAKTTARLIGRYIDGQKRLNSATYSGPRQKVESISGDATNGGYRNGSLFASPILQPVNWTRANTFTALQEWEGIIIAVNADHLVVNLVDLTAGKSRATEEAQIPLGEISEQDFPKLAVGRVFRWAIGYQRLKAGTKRRISNIIFRDLPQWTKRDFVEAQADAAKLMRFLGSDQSRAEISLTGSEQR